MGTIIFSRLMRISRNLLAERTESSTLLNIKWRWIRRWVRTFSDKDTACYDSKRLVTFNFDG
jgi:hypothetical protein